MTELPEEFMVRRIGDHWAVVGPTGVFVVGRVDGNISDAARQTAALAHQLRERLSESIHWVPFVDALLLSETQSGTLGVDTELDCSVVAPDLLLSALTSGAECLDFMKLHEIKLLLPGLSHALQEPDTLSRSAPT
ncbi:MAG TPA: hypothetical protein VL068_00215 [Microthrixaceae bacterium]|nr:hypothetical protein [Microthrixaceae bacterium]